MKIFPLQLVLKETAGDWKKPAEIGVLEYKIIVRSDINIMAAQDVPCFLSSISNNTYSVFTHGQKFFWGSCGIQNYMPRVPGRDSPPTHAWCDQRELDANRGPAPVTWGLTSGSSWRTLTQTVIHGWKDICKSPDFQRRNFRTLSKKKKKIHGTLEWAKSNSLTLPVSLISQGDTA